MSSAVNLRQPLEEQFRTCALYVALFSLLPFLIIAAVNVLDADLWWHLRTGQWMVEHRSVMHSDLFSWTGLGKPWASYSWLFEVLIYGFFVQFGLLGILIFTYTLLLSITISLNTLIRKFENRLAYSVGLTAVAMVAITRVSSPRPWLFTILFICIELNILVSVRKDRRFKKLLWLLLVFALWANVHIQFVYGFLVLGAAIAEEVLNRLFGARLKVGNDSEVPIPLNVSISITIGCILATLINPYHFRIYSVVIDTFKLGGLYDLIAELQSIPFRGLPDWLVLALVLGAAYVLGRDRSLNAFWLLLLVGSSFISFRGLRDVWFVVIIATTIIARSRSGKEGLIRKITKAQIGIVAVASFAVLMLIVSSLKITNSVLEETIAKTYPADAARIVEQQRFEGPLFNHSNWGGYLIWRLRQLPVSIDGRSNIHNAGDLRQNFDVWKGRPNWSQDPHLMASKIVIGEKDFALTQLLREDPHWRIAYEDNVAVVFVRQ